MNACLLKFATWALALGIGGLWGVCHATTNTVTEPLILAPAIIHRALEKALAMEKSEERSQYVFLLTTSVEDLDPRGKAKNRKEKVYEARVNEGWTALKLLRINGQDLTPAQLRREEEKDLRVRQQATQSSSSLGSDRRENFFTPELTRRYRFKLLGHEVIQGRTNYVLEFYPRGNDMPMKAAPDRLLNQMSGTLWIDARDLEVAKADFQLNGEVHLWGGILASLKKMECHLVRTRVAEGIWFNQSFDAFLEGRKLADPFHMHAQSTSTQFKRQPSEPPKLEKPE
jgi:hypothetical protein